jgi:2-aminobenzoate-CoA ligase
VKAWVVLREGHAPTAALVLQLQEFVKGRIAPYKYPRAMAFTAQLPRTTTGKLQRFRLASCVERPLEEEAGHA